MGILNVTPDSFSDGQAFFSIKKALSHAQKMLSEGANIIDVGGESSGPGSSFVDETEELRRVVPVIKKLAATLRTKRSTAIISVDTYKAEVARQAIAAGVRMINDVTALRGDPAAKAARRFKEGESEMARVVAESGVPVVLMYSKDPTARTTRIKKRYKDVVKTIMEFLDERIRFALRAKIKKSQIIIDPGMGAFVSGEPKYSLEILRRLGEFKKLGYPILVGVSRKSFLPGSLNERLVPSLISNLVAVKNGANIIRVHDVAAHRQFL